MLFFIKIVLENFELSIRQYEANILLNYTIEIVIFKFAHLDSI
jgi:hypothetical protein